MKILAALITLLGALTACNPATEYREVDPDLGEKDAIELEAAPDAPIQRPARTNKSDTSQACTLQFFEINQEAAQLPQHLISTSPLYDRVDFYLDEKIIGSLRATENPFVEDDLEGHFSKSCDIAWVGNIAFGSVEDNDGRIVKFHDKYYCAFIELPSMRLIGNFSGQMCDGKFDDEGRWKRHDGEESEIDSESSDNK